MTHAAPVSKASGARHGAVTGRTAGTAGIAGSTWAARTHRAPDVFDARTHAVAKWAVPVVGGLIYGYWAAANVRDAGPITGWNVLFGFVCAIVVAAAYIGVRMLAPVLRREEHALAWAVFAGVTFGFLFSLTGESVLRSTSVALGVAVFVFAGSFYRYYTHEDAAGHPVN
ncbi:hypothetical protein [Streptomyces mirabilis]|uniref:hypothetical protein n=1 Tax=Streptomyces mirabilis TaxID=68239 RepID=UPI000C4CA848